MNAIDVAAGPGADPRPTSSDAPWPRAPSSLERRVPCLPVAVLGLGSALPEHRISNAELADRLDTSDQWIWSRTGISARRQAGPHDSTVELARRAALDAIDASGVGAPDIDLVVVATSTPDSPCPSTAARLAATLGVAANGFDVNGACTGFVDALHTSSALLADPAIDHVLVVGAERYLSIVDPADRSTAVLFGDGAGAAVIGRTEARAGGPGVLSTDSGGDPSAVAVLEVVPGRRYLSMDGPELFRRATRGLVASGTAALARVGATGADVDLYVPHQANARIVTAAASRLGIDADRVVLDMAERANTSAASIPLALDASVRAGVLRPGMHVLITGIGAGLSWSTLLLRWGR